MRKEIQPQRPILLHGYGLGEYRRGHYAQALGQANPYLTTSEAGPLRYVWAMLTFGMSEHHLDHPAKARRALAQARERLAADDGFNRFFRHIRVLALTLLREAETLIEGMRPGTSNRD